MPSTGPTRALSGLGTHTISTKHIQVRAGGRRKCLRPAEQRAAPMSVQSSCSSGRRGRSSLGYARMYLRSSAPRFALHRLEPFIPKRPSGLSRLSQSGRAARLLPNIGCPGCRLIQMKRPLVTLNLRNETASHHFNQAPAGGWTLLKMLSRVRSF